MNAQKLVITEFFYNEYTKQLIYEKLSSTHIMFLNVFNRQLEGV